MQELMDKINVLFEIDVVESLHDNSEGHLDDSKNHS